MTTSDNDRSHIQTELIGALMSEDVVGAGIRAHLHIESRLIKMVELLVANSKRLKEANLSYRQLLYVALALGLNERFKGPLSLYGALRNDFAHKPGMKLTGKCVSDLQRSLNRRDRRVLMAAYEMLRRQFPGHSQVNFGNLNAKDRFTLITVTVDAALVAESLRLKRTA